MAKKINETFNPYFETLGLLDYSYDLAENKKKLIQELDKFGLAGETFYQQHFTDWEQVVEKFNQQKKVTDYYDFFFGDSPNETFLSLFLVILVGGDFQQLQQLKDSDHLRKIIKETALVAAFQEDLAQQEFPSFYELLTVLEIAASEKWKLFTIYQEPQKYLQFLTTLLVENLPLCQRIYQDENFEPLLENYEHKMAETDETLITQIGAGILNFPTFAYPLLQVVIENRFYYSLINIEFFSLEEYSKKIDDEILFKLKAISDPSKLQILVSLKEKPKYNLELAEEMQLSAGTISHHMGVLLVAELVYVEKAGGKVYYHLNQKQMEMMMIKLRTLLFD